ncbi:MULTISPECIES: ABC transporter permease [unclassified Treponema]|uniref:ABC transporter permease n=1 Tax=unclassified Treponema TaxID=2638727 RepID=UPI0020A317AE|nr:MULTISPECIES: ABC transporter permease [unclassified Treponema]UTC65931.1 ABC transporter permease [Treponema sp. OMZ 789]UTC68659.1 ABC transporter permease [Treponema sp. OMZ 790]UTC71389.1 ABC transporter permease [Treponema sp. OMZ 791]
MSCMQNKKLRCWLSISILILVVMGILTLWFDPNAYNPEMQFQSPSFRHVFGTDQFGRDVFLRSVQGFISVFFLAAAIFILSFIIGLYTGTAVAYYGGIADELFFHVSNFLLCFPVMIAIVILAAVFGAKTETMVVTLIVLNSFSLTRLIRAEIIVFKNSEFILNLKILGASNSRIIFYHLIPQSFKLMLPQAGMILGSIILSISAYSFLGFGVKPPHADIGLIMQESIRYINIAPWMVLCPGLLQFSVILCFTQLSEALKSAGEKRRSKHLVL